MASLLEWSLEAKIIAVAVVVVAVWAAYGYIRYGLDDPPSGSTPDGEDSRRRVGMFGLDVGLAVAGGLAVRIVFVAVVFGTVAIWSALSH